MIRLERPKSRLVKGPNFLVLAQLEAMDIHFSFKAITDKEPCI